MDEILRKERLYYDRNGNNLEFITPGSAEEREFFSYLHSVFKRYNIDSNKATRLEFDFAIRVAESEFYTQPANI